MADVIRASDAEREQAAGRLGEHAAAGRLNIEELTARWDAAFAARTRRELDELFADLPTEPEPPRTSHRTGAWTHTRIYVLLCLGMITIWAATGMGYFWPMWPILGWGIGIISHHRSPAKSGRCRTSRHRPSSPSSA